MDDDALRPLGLVLLPQPLETFPLRGEVEDLRRAGRLVAVDPPHVSYHRLARLPAVIAEILADGQARRLVKTLRKRGDVPRLVVIFHPAQYLIARGVLRRGDDAELWYRPLDPSGERRARATELHEQASARTALTLSPGPPGPEVAERLRELELAGG